MSTFMAVAKFLPETNMAAVFALRDQEMAQYSTLKKEGKLGSLFVSLPKKTIFLEVFADGLDAAEEIVRSLPMAPLWSAEFFPQTIPELTNTK